MHRRDLLQVAAVTAAGAMPASAAAAQARAPSPGANTVTTRDGTRLYYREWGAGPTILFVAAWGLSSEAWQYQMIRLSSEGFRCVAFDRRGHGRSADPGHGYDLDTLADDIGAVVDQLDLRSMTLVGHSLGAAESVRYLTRHGQAKVKRLALIAPTTPCITRSADNPDGVDTAVLEKGRAAAIRDFPGVLAANIKPFVVPETSQAMIDWIMAIMNQTSLKALIDSNRAFTAADFRPELPKLSLPTLILQGDADASAPLPLTGRKTAALIPHAELKVYAGAPHGLIFTHTDRVNEDLLAFARR